METTERAAEAVAAVAGAVDALVRLPAVGLSAAELQDHVVAVAPQVARLTGWLRAAEGQLQQVVGGELPTADGGRRSVAGWLADVEHATPSAVGRELKISAALRSLPLVADAVLDGLLTPDQAAVLSRLVGRIERDALAESQPQLIAVAAPLDPVELARWVRELIATHCEPELDAQEQRGRDRRYLQTSREADGSLRGRFVLAAEDSEALLTVLEPLARRDGLSDTRSSGQRRADALVEVCEQVLRHGDLPDSGGQRPHLAYVLPAEWAAARAAEAACRDCGARCEVHRPPSFADTVAASTPDGAGVPASHACAVAAWTGPQTRSRMEALLCDARISRVLLDTFGQVTGLEALQDTVTAAQRRVLAARDGGCSVRGCTRPPAMCDAHHLDSRADGGPTTLGNLVLLCRRHHVLWHLGKIGLSRLHVPWRDAHRVDAPRGGPPPSEWLGFPAPAGAHASG